MASKLITVTENEMVAIKTKRGKSEADLKKDIDIIKTWLEKQEHLPQNLSDHTLGEILHHCKYSVEKAKKKLDAFFSMPHIYPEYFENRSVYDPRIQECLEKTIFVFLPKLSDTFYRVSVYKECQINDDHVAKMILILMASEMRAQCDMNMGDCLIFDFESVNLSIALTFNPILVLKFFLILEKGFGHSLRSMHLLNLPSYGIAVYNTVKGLLRKKYQDKIHVHESYAELHKFFPKQILPSDYDGEERSLRELQGEWVSLLKKKNDYFQCRDERVSNESLRIGEIMENDILGIQGTFKQLNVD